MRWYLWALRRRRTLRAKLSLLCFLARWRWNKLLAAFAKPDPEYDAWLAQERREFEELLRDA